jgi:hypothetical protein
MNEKTIWKKCLAAGMTIAGAAGLIGNLYAESALNPKNLQQTYEKKLGYSDESYTAAVDSGKYTNFIRDCAGYGLAQWTFWTRKQALLNFAKSQGKSIGDLDMQLDFLIKELKSGYASVWKVLCTTDNIRTASNNVLFSYESPANQGTSVQNYRYNQAMRFYNDFISETTPNSDKSVSELAEEVLTDKWGTGAERKSRLTSAGYDYQAVQKAVNDILASKEVALIEEPETKEDSIIASVTMDGKIFSGTLTAK